MNAFDMSDLPFGCLGSPCEPCVDGMRSFAALAHCQDDLCSAQHDVATCEDSRNRGLHGVFVGDDPPMLVHLQTREGGGDQRVVFVADSHDDDIRRDITGLAGYGQGAPATRCVRFPEMHLLYSQAGDPSLTVAEDLHGFLEKMELDSLLDCMVILFFTGGHLLLRASIDDHDPEGSQPQRRPGRVHGDIAAAEDRHGLTTQDGSVRVLVVGVHEVGACQVLVGGIHAKQVLARDVQEIGKPGATPDENDVVVLAHFVDRYGLADDHVVLEVDAQRGQVGNLLIDDLLWQTELGDAISQDASRHVQRFEHGDGVTQLDEVTGHGEACGTAADDGHSLAARGWNLRDDRCVVLPFPVGQESFQLADLHSLSDVLVRLAHRAVLLTLVFLGAHTPADGWQQVGLLDDSYPGELVAGLDGLDEVGNAHADGAPFDTRLVGAMKAALRFLQRHCGGEPEGDLADVVDAFGRVLLGHDDRRQLQPSGSGHRDSPAPRPTWHSWS